VFKVKPVSEIAAKVRAEHRTGEAEPKYLFKSFTFRFAMVLAALTLIGMLWSLGFAAQGRVNTGRVAMQLCSCIYVANRDYDSCIADVPEEAKQMRITFGREAAEARFYGFATGVAQLTPGYGCHLKEPSGLVQRALGQ
jgi:hypothetical protein